MRAAMQLARAARAGSRSSMYQTHLPPVDLRAVCLVRAILLLLRLCASAGDRGAGARPEIEQPRFFLCARPVIAAVDFAWSLKSVSRRRPDAATSLC